MSSSMGMRTARCLLSADQATCMHTQEMKLHSLLQH